MKYLLQAVLPLKPAGTWGTDDLSRAKLLIRSIAREWRGSMPLTIRVILPKKSDLPAVWQALQTERGGGVAIGFSWDDVGLACAGANPKFTGHCWSKQQIVKICAAANNHTEWSLILDADVLAIRPFGQSKLVAAGKASTDWHEKQHAREWFIGAAELLGVLPVEDKECIGFTPQLVLNRAMRGLVAMLKERHGVGWPEVLSKRCWSEFALYQTYIEKVLGEPLEKYHDRGRTLHMFTVEQSAEGEAVNEIAKRYGLGEVS